MVKSMNNNDNLSRVTGYGSRVSTHALPRSQRSPRYPALHLQVKPANWVESGMQSPLLQGWRAHLLLSVGRDIGLDFSTFMILVDFSRFVDLIEFENLGQLVN